MFTPLAKSLTKVSQVWVSTYDALTARICEEAGVDVILVGDSVANVYLGFSSTVQISLEAMKIFTGAVSRSVSIPVVADIPFESTHSLDSIKRAAVGLIKEGASAVKLEIPSKEAVDWIMSVAELGIEVVAHIGLTPQTFMKIGGYKKRGKEKSDAQYLIKLAKLCENAGASCLVLEMVKPEVAGEITESLSIPTIGIGSGSNTTGQVLVFADLVGLNPDAPPFVKKFANCYQEALSGCKAFVETVKEGKGEAKVTKIAD